MLNLDQLQADLSAEFGGPALAAWPTKPGAKVRPHKGGDGGAKQMREQEEQRQARINQSVAMINGIFDGTPVSTVSGQLAPGIVKRFSGRDEPSSVKIDYGAFDPSKTYYLADGTEWRAPTVTRTVAPALRTGDEDERPRGVWRSAQAPQTITEVDQEALQRALAQGLYAERQTFTPSGPGRQALYDEQKQAVTDLNKLDVEKQFKDAERNARFGLARSGLLGGSEDVNVRADLAERQNKGLIQASALGDSAAAELKNQDERARQSLISMAQSGIDTGTAQSMAMKQLDAAAQAAKGDRQAATVGDLFGDMAQAYMLQRQRAGMNAGAQQYGTNSYGAGNVRTSYGGSTT